MEISSTSLVNVPFHKGTTALRVSMRPYDSFVWFWDINTNKLYLWNSIEWLVVAAGPIGDADSVDGYHASGIATAGKCFVLPIVTVIYVASNVTRTRTFDADTITLAELADVVGTIIADLVELKHFSDTAD